MSREKNRFSLLRSSPQISAINRERCVWLALVLIAAAWAQAAERHENFDKDPEWDGYQNRSGKPETIRQDFGWSPTTAHAGGTLGECGGFITPAAEPAYYAKRIPKRTFNDPLSASGTIFVEKGAGHTLLGFFNSSALNEWRTPSTIVFRINQRGDIFHCHVEYCTRRWRASAGVIGEHDKIRDRMKAKELPAGRAYPWTLSYDPAANEGRGVITATFGGNKAVCELSPGHKEDGAESDHFGLLNVNKQYDSGGKLWIDDLLINGEREDFSRDPRWESKNNRCAYPTDNVRPRFDFGYSRTYFAKGRGAGEMGGLFFRGDCRYPERLAAYGARLSRLTLDRPLRASGKVCLRRGVTDSTTLLGFYHSEHSLQVNPSQQCATPKDFLGVAIEGPSSEGFFFYPVYRNHAEGTDNGMRNQPPRIYPDGTAHDWTLAYDPGANGKGGRITVTLDGLATRMEMPVQNPKTGAQFNRFGLVTPWIDGNGQHVYFDDVAYTFQQE